MANFLEPSHLLSFLPNLLPNNAWCLKNQQDAIVALLHTIMTTLAFRFVAIDDTSSASTFDNNILPENWNGNGPGIYVLRYNHAQSNLEYVIKTMKMAGHTIINAIANEECFHYIILLIFAYKEFFRLRKLSLLMLLRMTTLPGHFSRILSKRRTHYYFKAIWGYTVSLSLCRFINSIFCRN